MFLISLALSMYLITMMFILLTIIISKKTVNWRDKWTSFECGFNHFNSARLPFSMRFFLIAIIFIIFDVEIVLIIPLTTTIFLSNLIKWTLSSNIFILIIIMGILIEWKENSLEWKK